MTAETALATRDMSLAEIGRRIDLNRQSGWGLERGTPAQLNLLALYCQKRQLLPGDEVTLYEGRPWITIDGHVTLMKRDPEYRGFSQRPLSRSEKEDWGYDPDDLVVETCIRTATLGEIRAYGKVGKDERMGAQVQGRRLNPVARFNPVEMAQKRSLARAHRFAFGLDSYVDDDAFERDVATVIEQRADPARVAADAARYHELYGSEDTATMFDLPEDRAAEVSTAPAASAGREAEAEPPPSSRRPAEEAEAERRQAYDEYRKLLKQAKAKLGDSLNAAEWVLRSDTPLEEIERKGVALGELLNPPQPTVAGAAF